jgi:hypothetical protein
VQNAKIWSDELAAVGKPIADEDLISFIVNGLNSQIFLASFQAEPISIYIYTNDGKPHIWANFFFFLQ